MEFLNSKDFIKNLRESALLNEEAVFRNVIDCDISWNDFINYRSDSNLIVQTRWDSEYLSVNFEADGSKLLGKYKSFSLFKNILISIWGNLVWDEPAIIMSDITGLGSGLVPHGDRCEQIHWNCIGSSIWIVKRFDGEEKKYILNPGDIIRMPINMYHCVETLYAPRAAIVYSIKNY